MASTKISKKRRTPKEWSCPLKEELTGTCERICRDSYKLLRCKTHNWWSPSTLDQEILILILLNGEEDHSTYFNNVDPKIIPDLINILTEDHISKIKTETDVYKKIGLGFLSSISVNWEGLLQISLDPKICTLVCEKFKDKLDTDFLGDMYISEPEYFPDWKVEIFKKLLDYDIEKDTE